MSIYTLHEGLFDKFKPKQLNNDDKKKYEAFLNDIYNQHISRWKKIIEDGIRITPMLNMDRFKVISSPNFIFQRGIKAHANMVVVDNYFSRAADDNMKNAIQMRITTIVSELRDYNKSNGIGWMEMIYEPSLTGFRIYAAILLKNIEDEALKEEVILTNNDADNFLESVGVELFEDSIAIDGTLYEGAYGESILEANGIFLYEDGIVLEGKQARDYRIRKEDEILNKSRKDYAATLKYDRMEEDKWSKDPNGKKAIRIVDGELSKRGILDKCKQYYNTLRPDAIKSTMRHDRKQAKKYAKPKSESTIFSDIDII